MALNMPGKIAAFVMSTLDQKWRCTSFSYLTITLGLCLLTLGFAEAGTLSWALDYGGDSPKSQLFFHDQRTLELVKLNLGQLINSSGLKGFQGIPNLVTVQDSRYVWSYSCQAHDCPYNKGFLWIDTKTGASFAAYFKVSFPKRHGLELEEFHELRIGGTARDLHQLPSRGLVALHLWLSQDRQRIDRVVYRGHNDAEALPPVEVSVAEISMSESAD